MPIYVEDLRKFGVKGVDGGEQMLLTKLEAESLKVPRVKKKPKNGALEHAAATGQVPECDLYAMRQNG